MPPNVQTAIINAAVAASPVVNAFWQMTEDPDTRPLEAGEAPADFLAKLRRGEYDSLEE